MALRLKHRQGKPVFNLGNNLDNYSENFDMYTETVQGQLNENGYTDEQENALEVLLSGANTFLTGNAGTGKSWLLNKFIEKATKLKKNLMVVAPTGISAINVDGATIHRSFKAPIGPLIDKPKFCVKELLSTDVLICDEISMCRVDLFDYMIYQIILANIARRKRGMADIQIVVCGDFFQLSPVITDKDREILEKYYGDLGRGYAFQSKYWGVCAFKYIVLKQIVRQSDMQMQRNLNGIRIGFKESLSYFNNKSNASLIDKAITLSGTNKQVDEINSSELDKLNSKSVYFEAVVKGEVKDSDKAVTDLVELKVGARVMVIINDSEELYQNGSLGTIEHINKNKDVVTVLLDTGNTVKIEKYTWNITKYGINNGGLSKEIIGTYTQIPLKLAYAITIHKSQGQTYDAVNIFPKCWDYGQLYVALSRCKSIDNMHLMEKISEWYLKTSPEVIDFYKGLK